VSAQLAQYVSRHSASTAAAAAAAGDMLRAKQSNTIARIAR